MIFKTNFISTTKHSTDINKRIVYNYQKTKQKVNTQIRKREPSFLNSLPTRPCKVNSSKFVFLAPIKVIPTSEKICYIYIIKILLGLSQLTKIMKSLLT